MSDLKWVGMQLNRMQSDIASLTTMERGIYLSLYARCAVRGSLSSDIGTLRVACGVTGKFDGSIQKVLDTCFTLSGEDEYTHPDVVSSSSLLRKNTF